METPASDMDELQRRTTKYMQIKELTEYWNQVPFIRDGPSIGPISTIRLTKINGWSENAFWLPTWIVEEM